MRQFGSCAVGCCRRSKNRGDQPWRISSPSAEPSCTEVETTRTARAVAGRWGTGRFLTAVAITVWPLFGATPSVAVIGQTCESETVGVDSSLAESLINQLFGGAAGQTFVARDTLITSISVWWRQPPGWPIATSPLMKPWITRVLDTAPDTFRDGILFEGPEIVVPINSDTTRVQAVRIQYRFDPPFQLPGPGMYAFFVQEPCAFPFDLFDHESNDAFPDGRMWRTGRSFSAGCPLSGRPRITP